MKNSGFLDAIDVIVSVFGDSYRIYQTCKLAPFSMLHLFAEKVTVSGKEAFILVLFFLLLFYSIISFLKSWNKNYRDINHLPFYTMCEEKNSIAPGKKRE